VIVLTRRPEDEIKKSYSVKPTDDFTRHYNWYDPTNSV